MDFSSRNAFIFLCGKPTYPQSFTSLNVLIRKLYCYNLWTYHPRSGLRMRISLQSCQHHLISYSLLCVCHRSDQIDAFVKEACRVCLWIIDCSNLTAESGVNIFAHRKLLSLQFSLSLIFGKLFILLQLTFRIHVLLRWGGGTIYRSNLLRYNLLLISDCSTEQFLQYLFDLFFI